MKGKKSWVLVVVLAIYAIDLSTMVWAEQGKQQPKEVKLLQAKIEKLQKAIESQRKIIGRLEKLLSKQIEENKRLQALCREAGIEAVSEVKANGDFNNIIYRGKKREQKWFDRMYKRFHDKIIYVNGEYVDIGNPEMQKWQNEAVSKGGIVKAHLGCKVFLVLDSGEAVIKKAATKSAPEIHFHLTGYEGLLIDNQSFSFDGYLIALGAFEYIGNRRSKKTVQSFKAFQPKPLTREQFAEVIDSGFKLVNYGKRHGKIMENLIR